MNTHQLLSQVERHLANHYSDRNAILQLLERAGVDVTTFRLENDGWPAWRHALNECQLQGADALESLMAEVLEAHPKLEPAQRLLHRLALGDPIEPAPGEGGGSLAEAVARDPLEGTDLLMAFAEAQGAGGQVLVQLSRCHHVLLEIDQERRKHGRMLAREKRWRKILLEIIDIAHELEGSHSSFEN